MSRRISLLRPDSFAELLRAATSEPRSVALLSDSQLLTLAAGMGPAMDPPLAAALRSELLLRVWLYTPERARKLRAEARGSASPALWAAFRREALPTRARLEPVPRPGDAFAAPDDESWKQLRERVADFLQADGLVALVTGEEGRQEEAIALPFKLRPDDPAPGCIHDLAGRTAHRLTPGAGELPPALAGLGVQLTCHLGEFAGRLEGRSYGLAVAVANAQRQGRLPAVRPLSLLATGTVAGDSVRLVGGWQAKQRLARRLGVSLFVAPALPAADGVLAVPPGCTVDEALRQVHDALLPLSVGGLTPRQTLDGLKALDFDVHMGRVGMDSARARLDQYESLLEKAPRDESYREGRARADVLAAAIANHSGAPDKARAQLEALAGDPSVPADIYCDLLARQVVSLTDLGLLGEAQALARHLLDKIEANPWRLAIGERNRVRMIAHGAYGGQVLLHQALLGAATPDESLDHLKQALQLARQLDDAGEICRDDVQVALWHALFDPTNAQTVIDATEKRLLAATERDRSVSLNYLRQHRFLAGYRALITGQRITPGFERWRLPDKAPAWLHATALKYRGALRAAAGDAKPAQGDFAAACASLENEVAPLLGFIGATVALQAGESLGVLDSEARSDHLKRAGLAFGAVAEALHGIHRDGGWGERARGLLEGKPPGALPNPQRNYRY